MRRVDFCRRPAWRRADHIQIGFARSEVPRKPAGFPNPVSTAVYPWIVLGYSRVCDAADLRLESSSGSRLPENLFFRQGGPADPRHPVR